MMAMTEQSRFEKSFSSFRKTIHRLEEMLDRRGRRSEPSQDAPAADRTPERERRPADGSTTATEDLR